MRRDQGRSAGEDRLVAERQARARNSRHRGDKEQQTDQHAHHRLGCRETRGRVLVHSDQRGRIRDARLGPLGERYALQQSRPVVTGGRSGGGGGRTDRVVGRLCDARGRAIRDVVTVMVKKYGGVYMFMKLWEDSMDSKR